MTVDEWFRTASDDRQSSGAPPTVIKADWFSRSTARINAEFRVSQAVDRVQGPDVRGPAPQLRPGRRRQSGLG